MVRSIGRETPEDQDTRVQSEEMKKRQAAEIERAEVYAELGKSEVGIKFVAVLKKDREQIIRDMVASKPDLASDGLFKGAVRIIDRIIDATATAQDYIDKQGRIPENKV